MFGEQRKRLELQYWNREGFEDALTGVILPAEGVKGHTPQQREEWRWGYRRGQEAVRYIRGKDRKS